MEHTKEEAAAAIEALRRNDPKAYARMRYMVRQPEVRRMLADIRRLRAENARLKAAAAAAAELEASK